MFTSNQELAAISDRMQGIGNWLDSMEQGRLACQSHLDHSTAEAAYWHSGYHQALSDVLNMLSAKSA